MSQELMEHTKDDFLLDINVRHKGRHWSDGFAISSKHPEKELKKMITEYVKFWATSVWETVEESLREAQVK